ncbi:CRISPR-associated helicase Cas3' [Roseofilum sp. BLCC_M154]|uniref:CRISPR-associated helicase Cas3 n=1 Tax=Roseofilum acuticapitatum BLCC-M154 TaxID=3022444 RepID=A0ABT7ATJ9_9CYAN|nr:CRISPR-associated helicase Cas3' [Roseofilum acuticapitatum]MDJ1170232.1 CRISPR-associated helicase Cas3' [Roseofilum acuticapitatum BLCC-M154]
MPKRYNFGRLFFPAELTPIPSEVRFQPLGNHVGNVIRLVQLWKDDNLYAPGWRDRVLEAAKVHDMGKPQHFEIKSETDKNGKFEKYIYSFKGHRFSAKSKDFWAQTLAIGHHDFSVQYITRDAYELRKNQKYADLLTQDPLAYARELYILEMCDQIEAELACRVLDDEKQAESRAFMEFTVTPQDRTTYLLDPWPFSEPSVSLTFRYWSVNPQEIDAKKELQDCVEGKKNKQPSYLGKTLDNLIKEWWKNLDTAPKQAEPVTITIKPHPSNEQSKDWTAQEFYQQIANFSPNPMQSEVFEALYDPEQTKHPAILLQSPTGTGKMEAVLFPALASGHRLILPLPARSLLDDQKGRIEKYIKEFSENNPGREFALVIDTGSQMYRWVYKDGEELPTRTTNPRRHLYKGDIILTTLDKFLYRYFAFGDSQKSFIFPLRIHESIIDRKKTLICFDEAHSYDDVAFTNFHSLVRSLYEAGRSLVLMTATMPQELIESFDYLDVIDYRHTADQAHPRSLEWFKHIKCFEQIDEEQKNYEDFQNQFSDLVVQQWQQRKNGRILAVVQTVRDAAAIYTKLKEQINSNPNSSERFLFLYHGRIADRNRPEIYREIKERDESNKPYILVTTSAIEVGCDLNAEILVTQICPPENLIQRVGRCNRRGDVLDAKVLIVGDLIPDFANTLNEQAWQNYQTILEHLTRFDPEKIAAFIVRDRQVDDYRVIELFSTLHNYVYQADLVSQNNHEKGLIITRSWTPSATLVYDDGTHGDEIKEMPKISVPIDRLIQKNDNSYANTYAYEEFYDKQETRWKSRELGWGCAYQKNIVVKISKSHDGAGLFEGKPEYVYDSELGFIELPGVFIKIKSKDFEEKLLYEHTDSYPKKSSILTYNRSLENDN